MKDRGVFADEIPFGSSPTAVVVSPILDDVQLMKLPNPEWLFEGAIPRRALIGLYGPPGSYKTTLAALLLIALATGRTWFGLRAARSGSSLYIGAEDVSGFKLRLAAGKRAAGVPLDEAIGVYTFPDAIDLRDPANVRRFIAHARATREIFELVAIDTFASVTPGSNENSSEDMGLAIANAQLVRDELDATVLLIHHSNAQGSRERGHSALRGAADTMISITPSDDVVLVECSKQRNAAPFETLVLKAVPAPDGGIVLRLAADVLPSTTLTPQQRKALLALRDSAGSDGLTKAAWRAVCHDMTERTFYKVAHVLEERRHVTRAGSGHFRVAGSGQC